MSALEKGIKTNALSKLRFCAILFQTVTGNNKSLSRSMVRKQRNFQYLSIMIYTDRIVCTFHLLFIYWLYLQQLIGCLVFMRHMLCPTGNEIRQCSFYVPQFLYRYLLLMFKWFWITKCDIDLLINWEKKQKQEKKKQKKMDM